MFLEDKKEYKKVNIVSKSLFLATLITMLISIVVKIGCDGDFAKSIAKFGTLLFFSGLIVETIPDFIEKNTKRVILSVLVIISLTTVWILM